MNKLSQSSQMSPAYALRKEYFGGLLLNFVQEDYVILNKDEFEFIRMLCEKNFLDNKISNPRHLEILKKFQEEGIVKLDKKGEVERCDIRIIKPPKKIINNCLTAPLKMFDTFTKKCNLKCKHCYASSSPLNSEKKRTLNQTKSIMKKFFDTGLLEWRFTGGEPTIAPDFFDAVKIAKDFRFKVSLNTNGCWTPEIAKKVLESGIRDIVISLEGPEFINDRRRCPGVFKRVLKTFDSIKRFNEINPKKKIKVAINMTVGKDNIGELEYITKLAVKYGFNINLVPLKPSGRAVENLTDSVMSKAEYMEFAKLVQKLRDQNLVKKSGIKIGLHHKDLFCPDYPDKSKLPYPFNYSQCSALTTAIDILPDGKLIACSFLMDKPEFYGPNLLEVSVYDAWQNQKMRRFSHCDRNECKDCRFYMKECRGPCRSTVILSGGSIKDGNLVGKDPFCFHDLVH